MPSLDPIRVSVTDTKAFREFVSHIQAVAERLEDIAGHGCVYVHEPCDKEWPGEQFKWCGACLSKVLLAELADGWLMFEPMQTSHLAPKIREERDRFRIEADRAMSEYDALCVDMCIALEALTRIEALRPNKAFDPWARAIAEEALDKISDHAKGMMS